MAKSKGQDRSVENDSADLAAIDPNSEAGRRLAAEKMMSTQLKEVSDQIGELVTKSANSELEARWQISQKLAEVKADTETYSDEDLELLVKRHGFESSAVRSFLAVAEFVSEDIYDRAVEFNSTIKARFGQITFTHLAQLARLEDVSDQKEVLQQIQRDSLSTLQTRDLINDKVRFDEVETRGTGKVKPGSVFKAVTKKAAALLEVLSKLDDDDLVEGVIRVVSHGTAKQTTVMVNSVTTVLQDVTATLEQLRLATATLETLSERVEKAVGDKAAKDAGTYAATEGSDESYDIVDVESDDTEGDFVAAEAEEYEAEEEYEDNNL